MRNLGELRTALISLANQQNAETQCEIDSQGSVLKPGAAFTLLWCLGSITVSSFSRTIFSHSGGEFKRQTHRRGERCTINGIRIIMPQIVSVPSSAFIHFSRSLFVLLYLFMHDAALINAPVILQAMASNCPPRMYNYRNLRDSSPQSALWSGAFTLYSFH